MSKVIKEMSSATAKRGRGHRKANAGKRTSYLRLYGDVVDELNEAVRFRVKDGQTRASIAKTAGIDPATLTRVLSGREGNNLRTIAAVLYGTEHRIKLQSVPCEHLSLWRESPALQKHKMFHVLDFQLSDGAWSLHSNLKAEPRCFGYVDDSDPKPLKRLDQEYFSTPNRWQKTSEVE